MKDQSKKVANLKHKEQVEKSKNAQLMEEARKREDNINESSQQVKVKSTWRLLFCDSIGWTIFQEFALGCFGVCIAKLVCLFTCVMLPNWNAGWIPVPLMNSDESGGCYSVNIET